MKVRPLACVLAFAVLAIPALGEEKAVEKPAPTADEKPAPKPSHDPHVERIVTIKNVEMMRQLRALAGAFNVSASEFQDLGILVLRGFPQSVAAAAQAVEKYDNARPARSAEPPNAEVTAYLVAAGQEPSPAGREMPEILSPVVAQMKERFPFKHYGLVDTLALRVSSDRLGHMSGVLPGLSAATRDKKTFYELTLEGVRIARGAEASALTNVHFGQLRLDLEVPVPAGADIVMRKVTIRSGVDLREGQKVVVGKTTLDGSGTSLILVLTVKVV